MIGLMIATYIAMDSFGTATNVTGDGAIAVIVNAIDSRMIRRENDKPTVNIFTFEKIFNFASIVHKRTTAVK